MCAMATSKKDNYSQKEIELLRHIRNAIMQSGRSPSIRDMQKTMGYKSPRSVTVLLRRLIDKGVIKKHGSRGLAIANEPEKTQYNALTINVPLVGEASCGFPLLAEEHILAMIPVSTELATPPHRYFLLRARGDSMDKAGIEDGDIILVRQQPTAKNGDIVVALIDSETTIKYVFKEKELLILKPFSRNNSHTPIVLHRDFIVQGVVVRSLGKIN
jgi:repressor LexA